jgi:hypothetical protein
MSKAMYEYTKSILERVSFDPLLFLQRVRKSNQNFTSYEMEQLREWLLNFTIERPELKQCLLIVNYKRNRLSVPFLFVW